MTPSTQKTNPVQAKPVTPPQPLVTIDANGRVDTSKLPKICELKAFNTGKLKSIDIQMSLGEKSEELKQQDLDPSI